MYEKDKVLMLDLRDRLPADLRRHVKQIIVFGSRVRGEATEDSDLDVAVLVDEKTPEIEEELETVAYQVMWDNDFRPIISLKVFGETQFCDAASKGFSFYRHVQKEGISL